MLKTKYTKKEKLQLKEKLPIIINQPKSSCARVGLDCTICPIHNNCTKWPDKNIKGYTSILDYRKDQAIKLYQQLFGEDSLFDILL